MLSFPYLKGQGVKSFESLYDMKKALPQHEVDALIPNLCTLI